jgi:formylglycine-generating enzyme required for sulfatase activity
MAAAAGLLILAAAFMLLRHPELPEDPSISVAVPGGHTLLVMTREVTRREWRACAEAGACEDLTGAIPPDEPEMPMTGVNRFDVDAYIAWRNAHANWQYRLPTAAEWKAIAADLPQTPYAKLFDDPRLAWAADYGAMKKVSGVVRPSGSFGALPNGVLDLDGNVWEWTSTCASQKIEPSRCPAFLVEGTHEAKLSVFVRDPASGGCAAGVPPANVGLRLVSDE